MITLNAPVKSMSKRQINTPQQTFLRDAMQRLDMDIDQFAARIRAPRSRVDAWLADPDDSRFQEMDPVIWTLVREISPTPYTPVLVALQQQRPSKSPAQPAYVRFTATPALAS